MFQRLFNGWHNARQEVSKRAPRGSGLLVKALAAVGATTMLWAGSAFAGMSGGLEKKYDTLADVPDEVIREKILEKAGDTRLFVLSSDDMREAMKTTNVGPYVAQAALSGGVDIGDNFFQAVAKKIDQRYAKGMAADQIESVLKGEGRMNILVAAMSGAAQNMFAMPPAGKDGVCLVVLDKRPGSTGPLGQDMRTIFEYAVGSDDVDAVVPQSLQKGVEKIAKVHEILGHCFDPIKQQEARYVSDGFKGNSSSFSKVDTSRKAALRAEIYADVGVQKFLKDNVKGNEDGVFWAHARSVLALFGDGRHVTHYEMAEVLAKAGGPDLGFSELSESRRIEAAKAVCSKIESGIKSWRTQRPGISKISMVEVHRVVRGMYEDGQFKGDEKTLVKDALKSMDEIQKIIAERKNAELAGQATRPSSDGVVASQKLDR